jgi:hypothetical protein
LGQLALTNGSTHSVAIASPLSLVAHEYDVRLSHSAGGCSVFIRRHISPWGSFMRDLPCEGSLPLCESFRCISWMTLNRGGGWLENTGPILPRSRWCFAADPAADADYLRSLSLLVSSLSSTNSKASGPTRAPPENGCSRAPMVNSTRAITPAKDTTISA